MVSVLVCGAGNASQAVSALLAVRYKVSVLCLYRDEADKWNKALQRTGEMTVTIGKIPLKTPGKLVRSKPDLITKDPACVQDCNIVILIQSRESHSDYLKELEPHVRPGTVFIIMPARSGCDFLLQNIMGVSKASSVGLVACETIPWACRFTENGWGAACEILACKATLEAAVTPPRGTNKRDLLQRVQGLLGVEPMLVELPNVLTISLGNPGQVIHTGILYGKWRNWDGMPQKDKPLFYHGVDEFTGKILNGLSEDIQSICTKLKSINPGFDTSQVKPIFQWYLTTYAPSIEDKSSLQKAMNTNKEYRGMTHPMKDNPAGGGYVPDFSFRYLSEDVPTGLCFTKGVACLLGVRTPTIDLVILWCQDKMGKTFVTKDGKMVGEDIGMTRAPQAYGVTNKQQLLEFLDLIGTGRSSRGCFSGICRS